MGSKEDPAQYKCYCPEALAVRSPQLNTNWLVYTPSGICPRLRSKPVVVIADARDDSVDREVHLDVIRTQGVLRSAPAMYE